MNGRDMSINGLYGAGNIQNRTSTRTLTLGNANANGDFSGVVSNTGGGASTQLLNVTKVGTGTQIFSGFNTYGGLTDVQAGTLVMASHAAAGFSSIQVSGGVLRIDPGADDALQLFKTVAHRRHDEHADRHDRHCQRRVRRVEGRGQLARHAPGLAERRHGPEHRQGTDQQLDPVES